MGPFIRAARRHGRGRRGRAQQRVGRRGSRLRVLPLTELLDGEVLDDPLLDLVEIVVVFVEDATRFDWIEAILRRFVPRDVQHPVDVGADHLVLGRRRGHALETIDFPHRHRLDPLGQVGFGDPRADLLHLAFAFSKLGLDRLQLLPQHVLALGVGHLFLGARFDAAFELEDLDLARQRHGHRVQLHFKVVLLEELLLVLRLHVEQAGQQVGDPQRVVHAGDERLDVRRQPRGEAQGAVDQLLKVTHAGVDGDGPLRRLLERFDQRLHDAAFRLEKLGTSAGDALDEHAHARLALGHLPDDAHRPDLVEIVGARLVRIVHLQQRHDHAVAGERPIHRFDRHGAVHPERRDTERQHHGAAQGNDRKLGGEWLCERLGHGKPSLHLLKV